MSINRVTLTGNLTRQVELLSTSGGTQVARFGIAVNDRRKNNQTGEWEDYPNYIECVMFGSRAENVSKYIGKGSRVAIEGRLHFSQWEKDGQKRSKIEVIVDEIVFMSQQNNSRPVQPMPQAQPIQQAQPMQPVMQQAQPMPQMQPVQPVQQQMAGMPQPQQVDYSIYDQDIPF